MPENFITEFDIGYSERMLMVCETAVNTFGTFTQTAKAVEELSELTKALARSLQFRSDIANIKDEIADCLIMICQMITIFGHEGIQEIINEKLFRLEGLISKEQNKLEEEKGH